MTGADTNACATSNRRSKFPAAGPGSGGCWALASRRLLSGPGAIGRSGAPGPARAGHPAHVRAKQKLQEALALDRPAREFCILVSDTVRWYLEERFDFRAPERTTEEFLHELQGTNLLTPDQKDSLGDFSTAATWSSSPSTSPANRSCASSMARPCGWSKKPSRAAPDSTRSASRQARDVPQPQRMTFGHPYFLLLLLLLPLLAWLKGSAASRRPSSIRPSSWCAAFST